MWWWRGEFFTGRVSPNESFKNDYYVSISVSQSHLYIEPSTRVTAPISGVPPSSLPYGIQLYTAPTRHGDQTRTALRPNAYGATERIRTERIRLRPNATVLDRTHTDQTHTVATKRIRHGGRTHTHTPREVCDEPLIPHLTRQPGLTLAVFRLPLHLWLRMCIGDLGWGPRTRHLVRYSSRWLLWGGNHAASRRT
jgi:hypothetical protein